MRELVRLEPRIEILSAKADGEGATRVAGQLRAVSQLLNPQRQSFNPLLLDLVPRLLDPSSLRQEIEIATTLKLERWYTIRNWSLLLLFALTVAILLLVTSTYLMFHDIPLASSVASLSLAFVDLIILFIWFYSGWRIQNSKRRTEHACTELSLEMQDITREFLLIAAEVRELPSEPSRALGIIADQIREAVEQLAQMNKQGISDLAITNQDAVDTLQMLSNEVKKRLDVFDGRITPAMLSFHDDTQVLYTSLSDYQQQLTRAASDLVDILRQIAVANADRLRIEQDLSLQIRGLNDVRLDTVNSLKDFTAAAANIHFAAQNMSLAARNVVDISNQLMSQQHRDVTEKVQEEQRGIRQDELSKRYDVFLCYHKEDKAFVMAIGEQLKERGILPWLDEWEIRPGTPWQSALENQISRIKSAAVFIGKGVEPWQRMEERAFLREFVKRGLPVIPVVLPECDKANPELPVFLKDMTWVDFRQKDPDPLEALIWGITGRMVVP